MMEKTTVQLGMLVRSYEGLRNWRALVLLACGALVGLALLAMSATLGVRLGWVFALLGGLLGVLVILAGMNGAGLLLVDQADGQPGRGFMAAFFGGLHATLTSFVSLLMLYLGLLLIVLVLGALALLSRIPGIGPLFAFLFAGPSTVILVFCIVVLVLGAPLLLVAVWRGEGVLGAIGRSMDILSRRPLETLLHLIVLWLVVVPVSLIATGLIWAGAGICLGLYAGAGGGMSSMFGGYGGYGGLSSMMFGQMGGAGASIAIVLAVVEAMFVLVSMFGYIMVFDSLNAGLAHETGDRLRDGFGQLRRKIQEHRPRSQPPAAPVSSPEARRCASCGAPLAEGDRFCGECGHAN